MVRGFYLGEFFSLLQEESIKVKDPNELAFRLLNKAELEPQAYHTEGYWIDHWRYNLDLIENFLYFYPDKLKQLFLDVKFKFWDDEHRVKTRKTRYHVRANQVYQGESLEISKAKREAIKKRNSFRNFLRTKGGKIYETNLISKLLSLILNKAATLDPKGIGIEMEADKPGWCDSLNGLPALFGSSVCETLELKRSCLILLKTIRQLKSEQVKTTPMLREVLLFFNELDSLLRKNLSSKGNNHDYTWWDKANSLKEHFRSKTFFSVSGQRREFLYRELRNS